MSVAFDFASGQDLPAAVLTASFAALGAASIAVLRTLTQWDPDEPTVAIGTPPGFVNLYGALTPGDQPFRTFFWNPSSGLADDGATVVNPTGNTGDGRWCVAKLSPSNLPVATTATAGIVQPDGTSLGITWSGVLSAIFGTAAGTVAQGNDSRINGAEQTANKDQPNGYAGVDGTGKIPVGLIPAGAIPAAYIAQGTWNASTNTPTLASSVGAAGYVYVVSASGTTSLNGNASWSVGDWALFGADGAWHRIPAFVGFQPTAAATLSALRTLSGTVDSQVIHTLGYASSGDGGDDVWEWNASSTDADDGLTTIKGTPSTGRFKSVTFKRRTKTAQLANLLASIENKIALGKPALVRVIGDSTTAFETSWMRSVMAALHGKFGDAGNVMTFLGDYSTVSPAGSLVQPYPLQSLPGTPPAWVNGVGGSGWQQQSFTGLGLRRAVGVNGTASNWTIQSPVNCTKIVVRYSLESGGGSVSWTIDGVSQTDIDCSGTQKYGQEAIVSGLTYGPHTVEFLAPTGGNVYLEAIKWCNDLPGIDFEESLLAGTGLFDYVRVRPISGGYYFPFGGNCAPIADAAYNGLDAVSGNNGATKPDFVILSPQAHNDVHVLVATYGTSVYSFSGGAGTNYDVSAKHLMATLQSLDIPALIVGEAAGWFQHPANLSYESGMWQEIRGLWHQICADPATYHAGLIDLETLLDSTAADIVAYSQHFNGSVSLGDNPPSDVTTGSAGATWWVHPLRGVYQRFANEILRQLGLPPARNAFDGRAIQADGQAPNAVMIAGQSMTPLYGVGAGLADNVTIEGRPRKVYALAERAMTIGGRWRTLWGCDDLLNWDASADWLGVIAHGGFWTANGTDQWGAWAAARVASGTGAAPNWLSITSSVNRVRKYSASFSTADGNPFTVAVVVSGKGYIWLDGYDAGASNFGKAIRMMVDGIDTGIDSTLSSGAHLNPEAVVWVDCPKPTVIFLAGKDQVGATNGWLNTNILSAYTDPDTGHDSLKVYGGWITKTSFPCRPKDRITSTTYPGAAAGAGSAAVPSSDIVVGHEFLESVNGHSVQKLVTGLDALSLNDLTKPYPLCSVLNKSSVGYWRQDTPSSGTWAGSYDATLGGLAKYNASLGSGNQTIDFEFQPSGSPISFPTGETFTILTRQFIPSSVCTSWGLYLYWDDLTSYRYNLNADFSWSQTNRVTLGTEMVSVSPIGANAVLQGRPFSATFTFPGSIPSGMASTGIMRAALFVAVTTGQGANVPVAPMTMVDGYIAAK